MTRGVVWNSIGTAFNQGSTFLVNIILAHLLARQAFGRYAIIQTTMSVASQIAQLSSGYTATRYVAEMRDREPARAGRVIGLCAVVSLSTGVIAALWLLLGAHWLAALLRSPDLTTGFMIAGPLVLLSVISAFLNGALAGLESYPAFGRAGIVAGVTYVLFGAAGARLGGINGALVGFVLSGCIQTLVLWILVLSEAHRFRIAINSGEAWRERSILFRFSLPAALNGFVTLPAIWTANAILARQPNGFEQVALFTAANSFRIIMLFLPNVLNTVGLSVLNNHRGAGDETRFRKLFRMNALLIFGAVAGGALLVAAAGPWLLKIFGRSFDAAYPVLLTLMLAACAETLSIVAFQIIQTQERLWLSFFGVAVPYAVVLVATSGVLAPVSGAIGLAWAFVASWSVALGVESLIVWRAGVWTPPRLANQPQ
jgi:O-antigen/teichoic acid export membrane protein